MARDTAVLYQMSHSVLSGKVCTYARTPQSITETGQLHSVGLGEHVKSRWAVQGTPRTKSPCVLMHAEAVFGCDILYLQMQSNIAARLLQAVT